MAESSPRYQQLTNEEDSEESPQVAADAPPPYSSVTADNSAFFDCKEDGIFPKPPSYNVATTLPSYDEAERTKAETNVPLVPGRDEDFVTRDDFEDADQLRIGNDGIFMLTFFMAFLFNWIGFFLSFCLTTSAAGRYGAISGFGLSLVKWILIVRVRDADITQHTYKHINCGLMYAQANQKPQTPLWYFNAISVVAGLLAPNCFLKDPFENCAASLSRF
uniref:Nedd4 family interacting protein 1 n=1 Tax=Neolamprologus brichardi TaxID=32507 RepID=A0A3Q4GVS8_NEOBR